MACGSGSAPARPRRISWIFSAARVREGLEVVGVPTSERTRLQAEGLGIQLSTLDETPELDLTIDGADEFDAELRLIKGGGGALLREKIVAAASTRMFVIADATKEVGDARRAFRCRSRSTASARARRGCTSSASRAASG